MCRNRVNTHTDPWDSDLKLSLGCQNPPNVIVRSSGDEWMSGATETGAQGQIQDFVIGKKFVIFFFLYKNHVKSV